MFQSFTFPEILFDEAMEAQNMKSGDEGVTLHYQDDSASSQVVVQIGNDKEMYQFKNINEFIDANQLKNRINAGKSSIPKNSKKKRKPYRKRRPNVRLNEIDPQNDKSMNTSKDEPIEDKIDPQNDKSMDTLKDEQIEDKNENSIDNYVTKELDGTIELQAKQSSKSDNDTPKTRAPKEKLKRKRMIIDTENHPEPILRKEDFVEYRLPHGWLKQGLRRKGGETSGHWDIYLISPNGKRLRSNVELESFLASNPNISIDRESTNSSRPRELIARAPKRKKVDQNAQSNQNQSSQENSGQQLQSNSNAETPKSHLVFQNENIILKKRTLSFSKLTKKENGSKIRGQKRKAESLLQHSPKVEDKQINNADANLQNKERHLDNNSKRRRKRNKKCSLKSASEDLPQNSQLKNSDAGIAPDELDQSNQAHASHQQKIENDVQDVNIAQSHKGKNEKFAESNDENVGQKNGKIQVDSLESKKSKFRNGKKSKSKLRRRNEKSLHQANTDAKKSSDQNSPSNTMLKSSEKSNDVTSGTRAGNESLNSKFEKSDVVVSVSVEDLPNNLDKTIHLNPEQSSVDSDPQRETYEPKVNVVTSGSVTESIEVSKSSGSISVSDNPNPTKEKFVNPQNTISASTRELQQKMTPSFICDFKQAGNDQIICGLPFEQEHAMIAHKLTHRNSYRFFQCAICELRFREITELTAHVKRCALNESVEESDEKQMNENCEITEINDESVESNGNDEIVKITHNGKANSIDSITKIIKNERAILKESIEINEMIEKSLNKRKFNLRCSKCDFKCSSHDEIIEHMNSIHISGKSSPLKCEKCAKEFKLNIKLKRHKCIENIQQLIR